MALVDNLGRFFQNDFVFVREFFTAELRSNKTLITINTDGDDLIFVDDKYHSSVFREIGLAPTNVSAFGQHFLSIRIHGLYSFIILNLIVFGSFRSVSLCLVVSLIALQSCFSNVTPFFEFPAGINFSASSENLVPFLCQKVL